MFASLADGLKISPEGSIGPKSSMIAENAQVVVMVPGGRAEKAESALSKIKTNIAIVTVMFFCVLLAVIVFMFLKFMQKRPVYEGKTLPSAHQEKVEVEKAVELVKPQKSKKITIEENIIHVVGPIPTWADVDSDKNEPRVSESDPKILEMVKAREQTTMHLESSISAKT